MSIAGGVAAGHITAPLPNRSTLIAKSRPGATLDGQRKNQFSYDSSETRPRRHLASFAASIAAHAVIVALIVWFASPLGRAHSEWVLAYLVEVGDSARGGGGGASAAAASGAAAILAESKTRASTRAARESRRRSAGLATAVASASGRDPAAARSAAPGTSAVGIDSGSGAQAITADAVADGGGSGNPNSMAHADYARNPPPVYPAVARRRDEQGTVTVRVLVGADGSVERAEIADSSGFETLDSAALETVRSRWRFVPARHGGVAVESWVLVPIRFALVEADATR